MTLYRTIIKRDGLNPLTGCAQYRVCSSKKALCQPDEILVMRTICGTLLSLATPKRYQPNTFINPRRAIGV